MLIAQIIARGQPEVPICLLDYLLETVGRDVKRAVT